MSWSAVTGRETLGPKRRVVLSGGPRIVKAGPLYMGINSPPQRFSVLDALRGVAALAVCAFHFTNGNETFLPEGALKFAGSFGWLGVEMFFVISGFIIPYALQRSGYRTANYGTFILKRIIRLDPPYLVGLAMIMALGYLSSAAPGFKGAPFEPSFIQVALHLGYVNFLFGYPWLNPVFWTLAIELQYYLLIGLLFSAVAHRSLAVRAGLFGSLAACALLVPGGQFIFHWLFLFMLGMAAFQLRVGLVARGPFIAWVSLLGLGAWHIHGVPVAVTGVATALLLGLFEGEVKGPLVWFGHISYSLYLVHVPIGGRVVNLGQRYVQTMPAKLAVLTLALATSVGVAWLLWRYVERPAQEWSSRIRYWKKENSGQLS